MPGRTPRHLPASSATVLRLAFLPPNPECSTDSSGPPDPLPPSDDLDWGQWPFPPAHPALLAPSAFRAPPPLLPSHLAAPDLVLSLSSSLVRSAGKTCYACSRSISLFSDCTFECVDHR